MKEIEWRAYYEYMILRGMRPEKEREMVQNCGGQKRVFVPDPADPPKKIEQIEPFDEALERIKSEIREMASRESLERRADQLIIELRRM